MKRVVEVAATATAASLLTGCTLFGAQENQTSPNDPMLETLFEETANYWAEQGVDPNVQLVTLQNPGDTFFCHNSEDTSNSSAMEVLRDSAIPIGVYCRGENTAAIISNSYVSGRDHFTDVLSSQAYARYIVSHEIGHHVAIDRRENTPGDEATGERRADCYAGAAIAGLAANEVPSIAAFLGSLDETDGNHGTGEQRKAAFMAGVEAPDGANCGLYYDS